MFMAPQPMSPDAVLAMRKLVITRNYKQVVSDRDLEQAYGKHCAIIKSYTTRTTFFAVS